MFLNHLTNSMTMKRIFPFIALLMTCLHAQVNAQVLKSKYLFDLELTVNPPQVIGPVLKGTRLIYSFKEGAVKGEKINGKVIECGGEWGLVVDSVTFKMDVRATVKTDDGALIYIAYTGFNYASPENSAIMRSGKDSSFLRMIITSGPSRCSRRAHRNMPGLTGPLPWVWAGLQGQEAGV